MDEQEVKDRAAAVAASERVVRLAKRHAPIEQIKRADRVAMTLWNKVWGKT